MDSSQKRNRDRRQREKRQEKENRRKERAATKAAARAAEAPDTATVPPDTTGAVAEESRKGVSP